MICNAVTSRVIRAAMLEDALVMVGGEAKTLWYPRWPKYEHLVYLGACLWIQ